jgi:O-antigen chain-terminating methyltransferase
LKGTLADRDAELLRVTDRARHIEASWLEMGKTLGERDAELGALGARLQSTQASESALRTELGTAQDALAGSESENARLRDAIGERDASARSAAEREATQRQQIDALYRSTSWRLTAPLRIIRGRFDRIRQKLTRTE